MATKKRWVQRIKIGKTTVSVPGATARAARANGTRFIKRHLKNVAMGFRDASGAFHPIRASEDYKPYRTGEFPRQGKSDEQRKAAQRKAERRMAQKRQAKRKK